MYKKIIIIGLSSLFLLLPACGNSEHLLKTETEPVTELPEEYLEDHPEYKLVWMDDFEGEEIDPMKWRCETLPAGLINNEKQCYAGDEMISVQDGILEITADLDKENGGYKSGLLNTYGLFYVSEGWIEVKMKLPNGHGVWPAFWLYGKLRDYPHCAEIDVVEAVNSWNTIYGTAHWGIEGKNKQFKAYPENPDDWHVYSIEWTHDSVTWYVDYESYGVLNINHKDAFQVDLNRELFLILNLAIGGDWPGSVDDSIIPQSLKVDYVKVYQKE